MTLFNRAKIKMIIMRIFPRPKLTPVNIRKQMLLCLIPFMDCYVMWRIGKIRKYVLLSLLISIPFIIATNVLFPDNINDTNEEVWLSFIFIHKDINYVVYEIFSTATAILFAMFLARRWSVQWNKSVAHE